MPSSLVSGQTVSVIGVGMGFPMRLDVTRSRIEILSEEELLWASIRSILLTDVTERPFCTRNGVPYGTRIRRALFEPREIAVDIIVYDVKRALDIWEPRITNVRVDVGEVPGNPMILPVTIPYTVRATGRADNYVLPLQLGNRSTGV